MPAALGNFIFSRFPSASFGKSAFILPLFLVNAEHVSKNNNKNKTMNDLTTWRRFAYKLVRLLESLVQFVPLLLLLEFLFSVTQFCSAAVGRPSRWRRPASRPGPVRCAPLLLLLAFLFSVTQFCSAAVGRPSRWRRPASRPGPVRCARAAAQLFVVLVQYSVRCCCAANGVADGKAWDGWIDYRDEIARNMRKEMSEMDPKRSCQDQ